VTVPFFETTRSLAAESRRPSMVAVVAAVVLLGAWGAWLFGGELPQRVEGSGALRGTRVIAELGRGRTIAVGRPAIVTLPGRAHPPLRAEVAAATLDAAASVELRVLDDVPPLGDEPVDVLVEVEVDRMSPWELLQQTLRGPS
jgi:hypothetical protein